MLSNYLGWIHTFNEFYTRSVRSILNGMVDILTASPDMKFIYAEISFFSRWYHDTTEENRRKVKTYVLLMSLSSEFKYVLLKSVTKWTIRDCHWCVGDDG